MEKGNGRFKKHVPKAGIDPYLNITVGHYNAHTEHLKQLLDYSKDQNIKHYLNVAVPAGMWQKKLKKLYVTTKTENI